MISALSLSLTQLLGFAFVDDTDLFCAGKTSTTTSEALSPDFQAALHRWTGDQIATGGSIAAEKLFCYLIDFKWNGSSWEYRKVDELSGQFSIQNKDGIQANLDRYAMDDNEEAEIEHLTTLSENFGHQLRTAKCEKNHTFQYSLMNFFEYPMVATQLDESTWTAILHPTL